MQLRAAAAARYFSPMADTKQIKISELRDSPFNARRKLGDLAELTASIKKHGVLQNLIGRKVQGKDGIELITGHRRKAGAKAAGVRELPVRVVEATDSEAREIQLIENLQRENLDAMEEAEAYGELQNLLGYTVEKIAEATGTKESTIYARLKLLDLLPPGRKALSEGHLNASLALRVARFKGERMQNAALAIVSVRNRWGDLMPDREASAKLKQLEASESAATARTASKASGERMLRNTIRRIRSYAMTRIVEAVERKQELQPHDLRIVVAALTADGAPEGLLERRGVENVKQLTARAQKMSGAELRALLVETALTSWVDEEADDANHRLKATVKAFGLDYRDLEQTVRELQLKEEQKAQAEGLFKKPA